MAHGTSSQYIHHEGTCLSILTQCLSHCRLFPRQSASWASVTFKEAALPHAPMWMALQSKNRWGGTAPKAVSPLLRVLLHDICSLPILACHSLRHRLRPGFGMLKVSSRVIEGEGQNADKVQMPALLIILTEGLRPGDHPESDLEPSVASSSPRPLLVGRFAAPPQGFCLALKSPSLIRASVIWDQLSSKPGEFQSPEMGWG